MKFNAWSKKRLELGVKRLTSRSEPIYDDSDTDYFVGPLPWKFIREFLFRDEGAVCPEELQRVINQVKRRKVGDEETFYVYVLKEMRKNEA
jgi:hypothetical protein